ncbi:DUF2332 domain-containing protein [Blastomonas sp.]|uniref:DUF2332 domain-containing protein n=1 Tax=Blastomonas sp. TaxID=1909299 RepID=UPI00391A6105
MNMIVHPGGRSELRRQAQRARLLGSPFVAEVLAAAERQLAYAPRTAALIGNWQGDAAAAALGLRLNSAVHALARRGTPPVLQALFNHCHNDFDAALATVFQTEDRFIANWMRNPTQTNEVGRAAALAAALMVVRQETGMPAALIEVGASCGLNLNLDLYGYVLGGTVAGNTTSQVLIAPVWSGSAPPSQPLEIVSARGVDLNPLDPRDAATRERLMAYVWADQPRRTNRLEQALDIARHAVPDVECADARPWLAERLAEPQAAGTCRVVIHSMVVQYFTRAERKAFGRMFREAGQRADAKRPLARIAFEWNLTRRQVHLTLTLWPQGSTRLLAVCHPYGDWIDWRV